MKKFSLRVNGARVGDAVRPVESPSEASVESMHRLPTRRAVVPRLNPSLIVRDYRDDEPNGDVG